MWIRRASRHLLMASATVLLGGLLGATLTRVAPGFGLDERELDPRLSQESLRAIRESRAEEENVATFYLQYLRKAWSGDLGVSRSLNRPVAELFSERVPVTLRSLALGLAGGWLLGIALAVPAALSRWWPYEVFFGLLGGIFLCIPSAVLAVLFLFVGGTVPAALALVVFPRVFRYVRNLLSQAYDRPHVLLAKAKGLSETRVLLWHVFPSAAPQIVALAGVSVSIAFGAAIPIEVICDSPGIGQLAWLAALGRDLPLLINLTVFVAVITVLANSVSDLAGAAFAANHPNP